jgi:hypothetical protein
MEADRDPEIFRPQQKRAEHKPEQSGRNRAHGRFPIRQSIPNAGARLGR